MTPDTILKLLNQIKYKDWNFRLLDKGDGFLLQVEFMAPDSTRATVKPVLQRGRKWYVSQHSCVGEIVRTAYKAIEAAELHEIQENFKFMGKRIFDPHLNPIDLASHIDFGDIRLSTRNSPAVSSANKEGK